MSTEWVDLPDMATLVSAQKYGWEIEYRHMAKEGWNSWTKTWWQEGSFFRGRPAQPKMKKVKILCWYDEGLSWVSEGLPCPDSWIRVPAEDKEIEVPE